MHSHSNSGAKQSKAVAHEQSKTNGLSLRAPAAQLMIGGIIQREKDGDNEEEDENHGELGQADGACSWVETGIAREGAFSATTARALLFPPQQGVGQGKFVAQLAHVQGASGPKDYQASEGKALTGIRYDRDAKGYIDFTQAPLAITTPLGFSPKKAHDNTDISDPNDASKLNLILANGTIPTLKASTRAQHFKVANQKNGIAGAASPDNYTWHHKDALGKMVLIDREVHKKHGHNGGKFLW